VNVLFLKNAIGVINIRMISDFTRAIAGQMQTGIDAQQKLATAANAWRKCWNLHETDTLNAEGVSEKFHVLLPLITNMRIAEQDIPSRQPTKIGDHNFSHLAAAAPCFDQPMAVSVKFEARVDENTLMQDNDETAVERATAETRTEKCVVYIQCQKPALPPKTTDFDRVRMQGPDFLGFMRTMDTLIHECQTGHMFFVDYSPLSDGVRVLEMFELVLAVLADMQHIRPYIVDLSGEYVSNCLQMVLTYELRMEHEVPILAEMPAGLRALAPYLTYLCIGSSYMSAFPEWIGEFRQLKVLDLQGSSRERSYLEINLTRYSNYSMTSLPDALWQLHSLEHLSLGLFMRIASLPCSMSSMSSLASLSLRDMFRPADNVIPGSIHTMPALVHLSISEIWRSELDFFLGGPRLPLPHLKTLHIFQCPFLDHLPDDFALFPGLESLEIDKLDDLVSLPYSLSCLQNLIILDLCDLQKLGQVPNAIANEEEEPEHKHHSMFEGLYNLRQLYMSEMSELQTLPTSMLQLTSLQLLHIGYMNISLPDWLTGMTNLATLMLCTLPQANSLPPHMHEMISLSRLCVMGLSIPQLPSKLWAMRNLKHLSLNGIPSLQQLPAGIEGMISLQEFDVSNCRDLHTLPDNLDACMSLTSLIIRNCTQLSRLPLGLSKIKQLTSLDISGMIKCLGNNNADIAAIGVLTNLTKLHLGPWDGDNFPVSLKRLVHLRHLALEIKSDESVCMRDMALFHKIAMIITHMPALETLRFGWCTYSTQQGVVVVHEETSGMRASFLALCAYPLPKLRTVHFCYDHAGHAGVSDVYGIFSTHARPLALNTWSQRSGFPAESAVWKDVDFMAAWRNSLDKVLTFMQLTHRRLGTDALATVLPSEMLRQICEHFLHRPEFEYMIRGIANL